MLVCVCLYLIVFVGLFFCVYRFNLVQVPLNITLLKGLFCFVAYICTYTFSV